MAKKPKIVDEVKLIETDHEEDKPLIRQIRKVAACNKTESAARDDSQEQRDKLIELMKERKLETYKYGKWFASIKHTDRVSVKSDADNGSDDGDVGE